MENKENPPPYLASPAPIGFEQSHQQTPPYPMPQPLFAPQQYSNGQGPPIPLNAYSGSPAGQVTYVSSPPTITALNSSPRYYQPFRGVGFRNSKHRYIGLAIYAVMLVVFIAVGVTIYVLVSRDIEESNRKHEEFKKKHGFF